MKTIASSQAPSFTKAEADAVCTGVNDEVLINGALAQGHVVQLSEGPFNVSSKILAIDGSVLMGRGREATIIKRAPGYQDSIVYGQSRRGVVLREFGVDDTYVGSAPDPPLLPMSVRLWDCRDSLIERVAVLNAYRLGIVVSQCEDVTVDGWLVTNARGRTMAQGGGGGHGVVVDSARAGDPNGKPSRNITIKNGTGRGNDRTAIYATGVEGLRVIDNDFLDNNPKDAVDRGIERGGQIGMAYGCTGAIVRGNVLRGGYWTQGIEVDVTEQNKPTSPRSGDITIEGNLIVDQGFAGVTIYGDPGADDEHRRANILVRGNVIRNCNRITTPSDGTGYGAIHVFATITDFQIDGNLVESSSVGSPGIRLAGQNNNYYVINNRVRLTKPSSAVVFAVSDGNGAGATRYVAQNLSSVVVA